MYDVYDDVFSKTQPNVDDRLTKFISNVDEQLRSQLDQYINSVIGIVTTSGEKYTGKFLEVSSGCLVLDDEDFGTIKVPFNMIDTLIVP